MYRSVETSCSIKPIGKIGERSSGPIGSLVSGFRGGIGLLGMSATMLYQCVGMSDSSSRIFRFMNGLPYGFRLGVSLLLLRFSSRGGCVMAMAMALSCGLPAVTGSAIGSLAMDSILSSSLDRKQNSLEQEGWLPIIALPEQFCTSALVIRVDQFTPGGLSLHCFLIALES